VEAGNQWRGGWGREAQFLNTEAVLVPLKARNEPKFLRRPVPIPPVDVWFQIFLTRETKIWITTRAVLLAC
jgi:hypothetical protein